GSQVPFVPSPADRPLVHGIASAIGGLGSRLLPYPALPILVRGRLVDRGLQVGPSLRVESIGERHGNGVEEPLQPLLVWVWGLSTWGASDQDPHRRHGGVGNVERLVGRTIDQRSRGPHLCH